jgi:ATP-dependent Clp protease ATP-binding subunit ClpA
VVNHIVPKCNDPDSGGRMIGNIITNTLLPALSREFLRKSLARKKSRKPELRSITTISCMPGLRRFGIMSVRP